MKDWIAIFKTGTHTDSAGNEKTWTEADLDRIAQYNPAQHEAPVVIGHPKDNSPAWGWVEAVKREGNILYATIKDLVPEFKDMVSKGLFKKRSISLYPDGTLRHIGYLGAMPPAVKGLADVAFNEGDQITIEYKEEGGSMLEEIKIMFTDMMTQIKGMMPDKKGESMAMTEQEVQQTIKDGIAAALKGKDAEFSEREVALKKKEDTLKTEATERKEKEIADFCEGLRKQGKLIPAMDKLGMGVTEFMGQIATMETTIEFGEGDKRAKQSPLEFMQAFLTGLPKAIEFGEVARRDKDPGAGGAGDKLSALTKKKLEEKKDYTYTKAFSEVQTENPELAEEYAEELKGQ